MRDIRKLKNWIKKLPPLATSLMAIIYWVIHPSKKKAVILPRSPFWVIYSDGKKWFIPEFTGGEVFGSIEHRLLKKYTLEGFIEIEEGGVVFDIGAFIGGFSSNAAEKAGKVVSIEPDPFNYFCLKKNTGEYENVNPVRKLVWKSNNEITLNWGTDPTDHSTLNVDGLKRDKAIKMKAIKIDTLAEDLGIKKIDFLKIDAEGAEPEVLEGGEKILESTKKIAIDCSPERYGKSTEHHVRRILSNAGFNLKSRNYIVYGARS